MVPPDWCRSLELECHGAVRPGGGAGTAGADVAPSAEDEGPHLRGVPPASAATSGAGAAAAGTAAAAAAKERLWFWCAVVENAAASEVAINVCLPWLVCHRQAGTWQAPRAALLGALVLALNVAGAFLEGFCKSTRLLAQTLRRTRSAHQLVFMTSHGFCDGFLNVVTSFPDIAGSGSDVALLTGSFLLATFYCLAHMVLGVLCYRWGRTIGWRCVQCRWDAVLCWCRLWPLAVRGIIITAFALLPFIGDSNVGGGRAGASFNSSAQGGGGSGGGGVPLDLTDPEVEVGARRALFAYEEFELALPPMVLGLTVGVFMSASGAALASLCCNVLCLPRARPAARFATNLVATLLVLIVRQGALPASGIAEGRPPFVLLKFATSFCGALSAFSGTIGDVTDAYFGTAVEQSVFDGTGRKGERMRGAWLPALTGAQNFLAHWLLTLVAMVIVFRSASQDPMQPIVRHMPRRERWVEDLTSGGRRVPLKPRLG